MTLSKRTVLKGCGGLVAFATSALLKVSPVRSTELDQKIGQLLVFGFAGTHRDAKGVRRAAAYIRDGKLGGVLHMHRNIRSKRDVALINNFFKDQATGPAPLIAIDHEGGLVQRLGHTLGFTQMPRARHVAGHFSPGDAENLYAIAARELAQTGFSLNLGPVVDLHDPLNGVIGQAGRAYSAETAKVSAYATAFVSAYKKAGILCALKHFPGHGRSRDDSHFRSADISPTWGSDELDPYRAMIASGTVDVVMSGHLTHKDLTGGLEPATFSRSAISGVLRHQMGFGGLAITDDLTMAGARRHGKIVDTMIRALQAGHDLLLIAKPGASSGRFVDYAIAGIADAVRSGRLQESAIDTAYSRVMETRQTIT